MYHVSIEQSRGLFPGGEQAALRHLQETHGAVLRAFLIRLTSGDVHRAEEIRQETLLRAWHDPQARTADGKWNRPWLFTVARRMAIDSIRSDRVRPGEVYDESLDARAPTGSAIERLLDGQEVRSALAALPERQRTVLVEIYFRERSVAEVAEILAVPPPTLKLRTFYALEALRAELISRGFGTDH